MLWDLGFILQGLCANEKADWKLVYKNGVKMSWLSFEISTTKPFSRVIKKHLRERWVPLFSALGVDNRKFSLFPPCAGVFFNLSHLLLTRFWKDFSFDCSDPKLELLVTWSEPSQTGLLVAHIYWGNRNMYLEELPFSPWHFLYDLLDQQFLCLLVLQITTVLSLNKLTSPLYRMEVCGIA